MNSARSQIPSLLFEKLDSIDSVHLLFSKIAGAKRAAKFSLQNLFDAAHYEVDYGLGGIDDAVSVGFFGRVSLEEALIDFC